MGEQMAVSDYDLLVLEGHSAAKAAEIVLDAQRGDERAAVWIATIRGQAAISRATGATDE